MRATTFSLSFFCIALSLGFAGSVSAQTQLQSSYTSQPQAASAVVQESAFSIFNDKIRRYRFDFNNGPVTHEAVEAFKARYDNGQRPAIYGAYADPKTNSLIVVAKPEAEEAIRECLAENMMTQWLGDYSLLMTQRELRHRRADMLTEMAHLEIALVDASSDEKAAPIKARLHEFEGELQNIEKKLQLVKKYLNQINEIESAEE